MTYDSEYWSPGPKYSMYLDRIRGLLSEEQRTVRDVYYALESRGFPEELRAEGYSFEYRYVKRAVKKGRRAGFIDPALIYDASRAAEATPDDGNDNPRTFLRKVEHSYRNYGENFWDDQEHHVEVWLEKQSLASVFAPICSDHNVRLEATRGDWSDSKVYETAERLKTRLREHDGDVRILYFGDFNPSGLHAPVAIQNTLRHYGLDLRHSIRDGGVEEDYYFNIWPFNGPLDDPESDGTLMFERVGLNIEHIKQYDLPENPTPSSTDKDRTLRDRFVAEVGRDVNIELNALKEYHRDDLEEMLEDAIEQYIDADAREKSRNRVQARRQAIKQAIEIDYDEVRGV